MGNFISSNASLFEQPREPLFSVRELSRIHTPGITGDINKGKMLSALIMRVENAVEEFLQDSHALNKTHMELQHLLLEYLNVTPTGVEAHEIAESITASYQYICYSGRIRRIIESTTDINSLVGDDIDITYDLVEILEILSTYN